MHVVTDVMETELYSVSESLHIYIYTCFSLLCSKIKS